MSTIVDGTTGITQLKGAGTTTNDNATAGQVGEYIENSASGIAITTGVAKTVTSITLSAGDWDVFGTCGYAFAGTPSTVFGGASLVDNTLGALNTIYACTTNASAGTQAFTIPSLRFSLSSSTVVYLVVNSGFTSTATASGRISARRVR